MHNIGETGTSRAAQKSDADAGLYYYRARYYDPTAGRFLSEDPGGFSAGVNFYPYTDNSPTNAIDPSGLDCTTKIIIVICRDQGEPPSILAAERAHENQHVRDNEKLILAVGLIGLAVGSRVNSDFCAYSEQHGYAAEIPLLRRRIDELKQKKCLTDDEKKELALLQEELQTATEISTNLNSAREYCKGR
jgi:RHS repeat-associated protein